MVNLLLGKTTYPSSEESSTGETGLSVNVGVMFVACSCLLMQRRKEDSEVRLLSECLHAAATVRSPSVAVTQIQTT